MNPSSIPDKGFIKSRPDQVSGPRMDEVLTTSRITVIEHVVYSTKTDQPHTVQSRFSRNQDTDEQVYKRQVIIGNEWTHLEPNWIKVCGMMILNNEEGKYKQRVMSKEEKITLNARILEVYFGPPGIPIIHVEQSSEPIDQWSKREELPTIEKRVQLVPWPMLLLPPGESQRYTPSAVDNIWLRCQSETAKIIITLIPG